MHSPAPTALIDFAPPTDGARRERLAFWEPIKVLCADTLDAVLSVLQQVEVEAKRGRWCVGFVAYEAAFAFDPSLRTHPPDGELVWFAVFDRVQPWPTLPTGSYERLSWRGGLDRCDFQRVIARIHAAIADGEVYQINFTAPWFSAFSGDPLALFQALLRAQPNGYAAYIDTGSQQVLSVSPELFFDWRDGRLLSRPMKGTAARLSDPAADAHRAHRLRTSEKERAENVMIVDLIRNDLSRVAEPHSVHVPRLFHLQALPTVWQMTSDVVARTRPNIGLPDVFRALFPCGSVTGAPKQRAMHWIAQLETVPRGVYCGAVGVVRPGGSATFNVPIRTVSVRSGMARCGIGSGITADSTVDGEWAEWRSKRSFLVRAESPFELLETMRLEDGCVKNLDEHLARMAAAARHFGFAWRRAQAQRVLRQLMTAHQVGQWRVRLLCGADGACRAEAFVLQDVNPPVRVRLADQPFGAADSEFVRFKTTRRSHYDAQAPHDPTLFDTLLWNEAGELTEFTRGNVAVKFGDHWFTPPLSCGLLGGIERQIALRQGRLIERVVYRRDLAQAQGLAFLNSLRGWLAAELIP
jgi:para-aminobenzoate synthetase/4-amino-4-deoxychorismate lyase